MDETILRKIEKYCVYQDRCHQEVRSKLLELGCRGVELEEIMAHLIAEDFLNEERYALAYTRGKFRIKKWGRVKIRQQLKAKEVTDYLIDRALKQIDASEYFGTLQELMQKKNDTITETNPLKRKEKLIRYLQSKGYEINLILECWQDMFTSP